jgi:hypothetical protein
MPAIGQFNQATYSRVKPKLQHHPTVLVLYRSNASFQSDKTLLLLRRVGDRTAVTPITGVTGCHWIDVLLISELVTVTQQLPGV